MPTIPVIPSAEAGSAAVIVLDNLIQSTHTDLASGQINGANITAAINALSGGTSQSTLIIPAGTYPLGKGAGNIDSAIQATYASNVTLKLDDGAIFVLADGANCYALHAQVCNDFYTTGGTWQCNAENQTTSPRPVYYNGWFTSLIWWEGCHRFGASRTSFTETIAYNVFGLFCTNWVTGCALASTIATAFANGTNGWEGAIFEHIFFSVNSDGIHTIGPGTRGYFNELRGTCGQFVYLGEEDYMNSQASYGSLTHITITNIYAINGESDPVRISGRNTKEGTGATQAGVQHINIDGIYGYLDVHTIVSMTGSNPITCTTADNHNYFNNTIIGIGGSQGKTAPNGNTTVTVTGPTTFTIPITDAGTYTANSATCSQAENGAVTISDDSSVTAKTMSPGNSTITTAAGNFITFTPQNMTGGSGGTAWAITPGATVIIGGDGTNAGENVLVAYCTATTFTAWTVLRPHLANLSALSGNSVGTMTACYVDDVSINNVRCVTAPFVAVIGLSCTNIQTLRINNTHMSGVKSSVTKPIAINQSAGFVRNLIIKGLTADQAYPGWGIQLAGQVVHASIDGVIINSTGNTSRVIYNAGNVTSLDISNCYAKDHDTLIYHSASANTVNTVYNVVNCTSYNGGTLFQSNPVSSGVVPTFNVSNCKCLGTGSEMIYSGASYTTNIGNFNMRNCSLGASTLFARGGAQLLNLNGDITTPLDGTLQVVAPTSGYSFYNSNVAFGVGIGYYTFDGFNWYQGIGSGTSTLFDHFVDAGNTTTTETDLYTDTTLANTLEVNGAKLRAVYGGITVLSATATRTFRVYFGGTAIFNSGGVITTSTGNWTIDVDIIRVSSTVIRYTIRLLLSGVVTEVYTATGELTGLTLSNTNILKLTGQAGSTGAATNDIVAKMGYVEKKRA